MADSLNIYYQNIRGMNTKLSAIYTELSAGEFDVIVLTETWLSELIYDSEFCNIDRYVVYRRDRCNPLVRRGGGVLILVSRAFSSRLRLDWSTSAEDLWVTLYTNSHRKINLCVAYFPPGTGFESYGEHLDRIDQLVAAGDSSDAFLVVGDYNLPFIEWTLQRDGSCLPILSRRGAIALRLLNTIDFCNLTQFNSIVNSQSRVLDLVLCTEKCIVTKCDFPLSTVDVYHPPLNLCLPSQIVKSMDSNLGFVDYDFNSCNYEDLIYKLACVDWNHRLSHSDINDNLLCFYDILGTIMNNYIKKKTLRKSRYPVWYSKTLIRLIREKDRLHKKWKNYSNAVDYISFSCLRKRVKLTIDIDYRSYIDDIERRLGSGECKPFWRYVNGFRKSNTLPNVFKYDGIDASNGTDICNMFADYFESVYVSDIPGGGVAPNSSYLFRDALDLHSVEITREDVFKHLAGLKISGGCGPDRIPPRFIVACSHYLAEPMCILFNQSLSLGIFPALWKKSYVKPIHKTGAKDEVTNYRPISILNSFSKVFECIIVEKIKFFLSGVFIPEQSGFCPGRSVETNLVPLVEFLCSNMDSRVQVDVVYTDFSKAFDRVILSLLTRKLRDGGIHGSLLRWLDSYIRNRSQIVVCMGFVSRTIYIPSGVPQGSHLGPWLFNLYINDIAGCFRNSSFRLFADDLKIYRPIKSLDDCLLLQQDLERLCAYCDLNQLSLNAKKCSVVNFTRNKSIIAFEYIINGITIANLPSVRDLGILFDRKLLFNEHIDAIVSSSLRMLGFLFRATRSFSNHRSLITLYNTLIRSRLEFCTTVWSPGYAVNISLLESVQRKFVSMLSFRTDSPRLCYLDALSHFGFLTLENRRVVNDMLFLYKCWNGYVDATLFLHLFTLRASPRFTRSDDLFYIQTANTNNYVTSAIYRMMRTYNGRFAKIDLFALTLPRFKREVLSLLR